jgi:hypothetical protein
MRIGDVGGWPRGKFGNRGGIGATFSEKTSAGALIKKAGWNRPLDMLGWRVKPE